MNKKEIIFFLSPIFLGIFIVFFFLSFTIGRTVGTSMLPTIKNNGWFLMKKAFLPLNLTNYIVCFVWNKTLDIMHRCLMDNGTYILTKGDNNQADDGWINKNNVTGIVVWHS